MVLKGSKCSINWTSRKITDIRVIEILPEFYFYPLFAISKRYSLPMNSFYCLVRSDKISDTVKMGISLTDKIHGGWLHLKQRISQIMKQLSHFVTMRKFLSFTQTNHLKDTLKIKSYQCFNNQLISQRDCNKSKSYLWGELWETKAPQFKWSSD